MTPSQVRATFDRILAKARDLQSLVPGNPVEPSRLSPDEISSLWREHRHHVGQAIASHLQPGMRRIAIVGAGRCDSFSLPDLILLCRTLSIPQIDLIDINASAMCEALARAQSQSGGDLLESHGIPELRLPDTFLCRALPCDITQMMPLLLDRLDADLRRTLDLEISAGTSPPLAMAAIVRNLLLECIQSRALQLPTPPYDLTVSDSVLTQINSFFGVAVSSHWIDLLRVSPPDFLDQMIFAHEEILSRDHIAILAQLTRPGARILLISDVERTVAGQPPRPRFLARGTSLVDIVSSLHSGAEITGASGPWPWLRTRSESEKVMAVTLDPHPTAICPGR